jgi:serine/threonine protein kinase
MLSINSKDKYTKKLFDKTEDWKNFPEIQGKYLIINKVGSGTFSDVYHAISLKNKDKHYALKRIKRTVHPDRIFNEVEILQKLE